MVRVKPSAQSWRLHSRIPRLSVQGILDAVTGCRTQFLVLLQNAATGRRGEWRACSPGNELRGDAENEMDELTLTHRITLRDPADLTFSDCMHRLVTLDRSRAARGIALAVFRSRYTVPDQINQVCNRTGKPSGVYPPKPRPTA
jgi:hypothetical protein